MLTYAFCGCDQLLSFYVMQSTFMQCEQFVELTSFIGKEYSEVVVLSRARTTTFVLLSCEEANWDLLCDSMGSRPYC